MMVRVGVGVRFRVNLDEEFKCLVYTDRPLSGEWDSGHVKVVVTLHTVTYSTVFYQRANQRDGLTDHDRVPHPT